MSVCGAGPGFARRLYVYGVWVGHSGGRLFLNRSAFDTGKRFTNELDPMRARRRRGDEIIPDLSGLLALSILLGGKPQVETGAYDLGVDRHGSFEGGLRLGGDFVVSRSDQRLAKIGLAIRGLTR